MNQMNDASNCDSHNVYNAYNNNDNAFLFDSVSNQYQQDIYNVNCDGFQQHASYPLDNKSPDNSLYDCTFMNGNLLYKHSVFHNIVSYKLNDHSTLNEKYFQDDNFSIATVSDFNNISSQALTPLSTPSPQLSELHTNYNNNIQFIQPLYNSIQENFLFAPIEESLHQYRSGSSRGSKKSNCTDETEKKHICPVCNHKSKRKHNLVEHMLTHNPNRPKDFRCSFCSRPFARKYDMKRHERIHTR